MIRLQSNEQNQHFARQKRVKHELHFLQNPKLNSPLTSTEDLNYRTGYLPLFFHIDEYARLSTEHTLVRDLMIPTKIAAKRFGSQLLTLIFVVYESFQRHGSYCSWTKRQIVAIEIVVVDVVAVVPAVAHSEVPSTSPHHHS